MRRSCAGGVPAPGKGAACARASNWPARRNSSIRAPGGSEMPLEGAAGPGAGLHRIVCARRNAASGLNQPAGARPPGAERASSLYGAVSRLLGMLRAAAAAPAYHLSSAEIQQRANVVAMSAAAGRVTGRRYRARAHLQHRHERRSCVGICAGSASGGLVMRLSSRRPWRNRPASVLAFSMRRRRMRRYSAKHQGELSWRGTQMAATLRIEAASSTAQRRHAGIIAPARKYGVRHRSSVRWPGSVGGAWHRGGGEAIAGCRARGPRA